MFYDFAGCLRALAASEALASAKLKVDRPSEPLSLLLSYMTNFMSLGKVLKRGLMTSLIDVKGKYAPQDFTIFPGFFTLPEQRILLATALQKLDARESRQFRRRRQDFLRNKLENEPRISTDLGSLFLPDEYYQMEEVHTSNFPWRLSLKLIWP